MEGESAVLDDNDEFEKPLPLNLENVRALIASFKASNAFFKSIGQYDPVGEDCINDLERVEAHLLRGYHA